MPVMSTNIFIYPCVTGQVFLNCTLDNLQKNMTFQLKTNNEFIYKLKINIIYIPCIYF